MSANLVYQFDHYRVDPAKRELWCEGKLIALQPKAFDCLVYLLEHRDRVVGHDELIATIWGRVEIGDSVLGQIISRIRSVLNDNANKQLTIRTITRVGYIWVMPVRVLSSEAETPAAAEERAGADENAATAVAADDDAAATIPATAVPAAGRRKAAALLLGVLALLAALLVLRHFAPRPVTPTEAAADTAVILPVSAPREPSNAWIRLGVMDLIGERLRAAGQTVVPSDNVVALARGLAAEPSAADIDALAGAAAASIVLRASAEPREGGWRVELATVHGRERALVAHGDGDNVIDAARIAADRMAILLGLAVVGPDAGTAHSDPLDYLLQQVKAAMLVDRLDEARALLGKSGPYDDPRILYQRGDIELRAGNYAVAQHQFEALLDQVSAERDPTLRAQILHGLAFSHIRQLHYDQARPCADEAIRLLDGREPFGKAQDTLGFALSTRAFLRRVLDRDYDAAQADYSKARVLFESSGNQLALVRLDMNLSMLLGDANRAAEALSLGHAVLGQVARFGDLQSELRLRVTLAELHGDRLEAAAALTEAREFDRLIAQIDNPDLAELASLIKVGVLLDNGLLGEASETVQSLLARPRPADEGTRKGLWPEYTAAWLAWEIGDPEQAARLAADALARHAEVPTASPGNIAYTWLTQHRAELALGRPEAAARTRAAAQAWAQSRLKEAQVARWLLLLHAEAAAAAGDTAEAGRQYEAAWAQAIARAVPREMLDVASSYCRFLFANGQLQQATLIAGHVARWSQSSYAAALLQTRLHHALGQTSAWRRALERSRQLAGERRLPPEILDPPRAP